MNNNQRPGVYSRVEISGYRAGVGRGAAALLLPCREGESLGVYKLGSYRDASGTLKGNRLALECARLLFEGAARVTVVTAPSAAQAILEASAVDFRVIVSGFTSTGELSALRDYVGLAAHAGRECIAFAGIGEPEAAASAAQAMNSGRMVLCCPALEIAGGTPEEGAQPQAIYGACALAAAVLSAPSPVSNFDGLALEGLHLPEPLPEDEIQRLIGAGVCVFEQVGDVVELIRAVSTHTRVEGGGSLLRSLNTVLIIDDVMAGIRGALKGKLSGSGKVSLESLRDLVAVGLRGKQDDGIIMSFALPRVRPKEGDPSVALVEISFRAAHLLSQIHLTANIRV